MNARRRFGLLPVLPVLLGLLACGESAADGNAGTGEPGTAPRESRALGAAEVTPPPFVLTAGQERGREVFEGVCWTCHGSSARADGPMVRQGAVPAPPNFMEGEYPNLTPNQLAARFRDALTGQDTTHPHMKNVISFLAEESFIDALSYVPALLYPPEVPGSALQGWKIYDFRCASCHGPEGRGQGPVANQLVVAPANFTADTLITAGNFEGLHERIRVGGGPVHGSAMPPWGQIFGDGEIWDLVAFISTFQPQRLSPPPTGGRP